MINAQNSCAALKKKYKFKRTAFLFEVEKILLTLNLLLVYIYI